jgi:hypothetical protein
MGYQQQGLGALAVIALAGLVLIGDALFAIGIAGELFR